MNIKSLIKKALAKSEWDFANSILYNLCENYREHKSDEIILAKIWIIGRSYAAAIERRKNSEDDINDDFYIEKVVPKIRESNIDTFINQCMKTRQREDALIAHKKLTDLFFELTDLNKRSLASKYLHFHMRDKFYIYDSRVVSSVGILSRELKLGNLTAEISINYDEAYAIFYLKCERIVNKIKSEYGIQLTCRQLDNLLIQIANDKLR